MADVDKGEGDRAAGNLRFTASEMLIYILLIQLKVDTVSLSIDIYQAMWITKCVFIQQHSLWHTQEATEL